MRRSTICCSFLIRVYLILSICSIGCAKYVKGTLNDPLNDWSFINRFCFLSELGELRFELTFPVEYSPVALLLYYDTYWPEVYKSDKTCFEKQQPPYIVPENGQVFVLMEGSYCVFPGGDNKTLSCSATRSFRSARERWWFLVVSRCYQEKLLGISLNYEIWMTNGPEGDLFHRQFSADEFYILEVDIAFLLAISVLVVLSLIVAAMLRKKRMFHTTFKLYMVSLFFEFFHLLVMCISYGKYANDGEDNYGSKTFGRVLEAVSILVFILMLILMAKGFTITRGRISTSGSVKIAVFMTLYVITYAILFIYEAAWFDPGLVLYLYESPAGYGLLGLRLIAWLWFCYAVFFTLKHFPGKSKFYYPFFIFYTFWFWAAVVVILIANFAIAKWVREKVVNGIECSISFSGLAVFLFLTRPSNANKNFPYHARTTQVGDMGSTGNGGNGTMTQNQLGYIPVAEASTAGTPNFTALFTVSSGRQSQYQVKTADNIRPANNVWADGVESESTWRNGNFFITEKSASS